MGEKHLLRHGQMSSREVLIPQRWLDRRDKADKAYLVHKDDLNRLGGFCDWLDAAGMPWYAPDLAAYRDYLLDEYVSDHTGRSLSPSSVRSHLSTIRGRYKALVEDNAIRDQLWHMIDPDVALVTRKALIDELIVRLTNAIQPHHSQVEIVTEQDVTDDKHLRLKPHEVQRLQMAPGTDTLKGLRDTAMIVLLTCTGVREDELCKLAVSDLRQRMGDELALLVREGKGLKQRLVPYGPLDWCLLYVDRWLAVADIADGPVFRGFYKGNKRVRQGRISSRAIINIIGAYPIAVGDRVREVKPHDLRRSYARNAYLSGMDLERIRQNLGHADIKTTQGYIGTLDATERRPPAMYDVPDDIGELQARWLVT